MSFLDLFPYNYIEIIFQIIQASFPGISAAHSLLWGQVLFSSWPCIEGLGQNCSTVR